MVNEKERAPLECQVDSESFVELEGGLDITAVERLEVPIDGGQSLGLGSAALGEQHRHHSHHQHGGARRR